MINIILIMKTSLYNLLADGKRFNSVKEAAEYYKFSESALKNSIQRSKDKDNKTFTVKVKGITFIIINTVKTNNLV